MHFNACKKLICLFLTFLLIPFCTFPAETYPFSQKAEAKPNGILLPIIMYHEVKPYKTRKDVITPYEIESDLKYLTANHYTTITMSDLIDYVDGKKGLPDKPIILSFDDGYYNNYVYVFPLLKKYHTKIVFSLIGIYTDDATRYPENNLNFSHVSWNQINEMIESGLVEVQNHTYNLHTVNLKRYGCRRNKGESLEHYDQVLTEDIGKLQQEITTMTGETPNTFAYPYGAVSKESYPIIKKLGFKASLTCDYGLNFIEKNPETLYGLKRICRAHNVSLQKALTKAIKN